MRISRLDVSIAAIGYICSGAKIAEAITYDNSWLAIGGAGLAIVATAYMELTIREAERSQNNKKVEVNKTKRLPKRLAK